MNEKHDLNDVKMNDDLALSILEQVPTPIMAVDLNLKLIFMNQAGCRLLGKKQDVLKGQHCYDLFKSQHCQTPECQMQKVMEGGESCTSRNEVTINGRTVPIEYTAATLKDKDGNIVGGLEYILDITQRVKREQKLREQSRTIMEISTPAINLWDKIFILPIVGVVDSHRAQQMMDTVLKKISETLSKVIIIDIQGVAAVDTAVANHLIKIAKAARLMGCQCILSGISSAVAQTIVQLGINLDMVITNSTLHDALNDAFSLLNLEVNKKAE